jgi:hypothetical protein
MEQSVTATLVVLPLLLFVLFIAYSTFNRLVKIERESFLEQWIDDGRPAEWNWRLFISHPRGDKLATLSSMAVLLFHTPEWVRENTQASRLLSRYRLSALIWNIGCIVVVQK